ncbi:BRCA1 protein, partial [Cooperia oncophora]
YSPFALPIYPAYYCSEAVEEAPETHNEQIFVGKLFILTSANRPNTDTGFKKKFMTDFISTHGGLVVDDMKEVDEHPEMERFLISDTHYRTHKYLAALVRAMPCVSHEWISKCLDEKKLVDYKPFLLPSGVSILDEREYPLPTKRGLLLRNKRVMVHSNVTPPSKKSMSFEQIWVPMVPQLGGEIVTEMPNEHGKLDILLTDHSATPSLVEKARKIGCVVVSSEWLIQGIIMDRLPDVNAHQKFLHNGGVCT